MAKINHIDVHLMLRQNVYRSKVPTGEYECTGLVRDTIDVVAGGCGYPDVDAPGWSAQLRTRCDDIFVFTSGYEQEVILSKDRNDIF